jgi:hypothetical protein
MKSAGKDAKKQRTRMLRVWGTLVIAMSTGSGLLAWLAPPGAGRSSHSWDESVAMAHDAVARRARVASGWRGIAVVPQSQVGDSIQLTSVSGQPEAHFTITRDGTVHAHPNWIEQFAVDEAREVRIALAAGAATEIAPSQVAGLRALLAELRESLGSAAPAGVVPIHLDQSELPQISQRLQAQLVAAISR